MAYIGINNLPKEILSIFFGVNNLPKIVNEIYMGINNVPILIYPQYYENDRDLGSETIGMWDLYRASLNTEGSAVLERSSCSIGTSYSGGLTTSEGYIWFQSKEKINLTGYKYFYAVFGMSYNYSTRLGYTQKNASRIDIDNEVLYSYGTYNNLIPSDGSDLKILYNITKDSITNPSYLKIGVSITSGGSSLPLYIKKLIMTNHPENYTYHNFGYITL